MQYSPFNHSSRNPFSPATSFPINQNSIINHQEMSLFRSEKMSLAQIYIPAEIAPATIAELGEASLIQFRDLDPQTTAFSRPFVSEIRRLDDMQRRMRFLQQQLEKADIPIKSITSSNNGQSGYLPLNNTIGIGQQQFDTSIPYSASRSHQLIEELEQTLDSHDDKVRQMNQYQEGLNKRMLELTEIKYVLREVNEFFVSIHGPIPTPRRRESLLVDISEDDLRQSFDNPDQPLNQSGLSKVAWIAGTISSDKLPVFERILWRVLRGNVFLSTSDIEDLIIDPESQEPMQKSVFIIFAQAGPEIMSKIKKISESLGATLYPVEEDRIKRREDAQQVEERIQDLQNVLYNTKITRRSELLQVSESLAVWEDVVKKEKSIYHALNMCHYDKDGKTILAEGWIPTSSLSEAKQLLKLAAERTGATVPPVLNVLETSTMPPTYFRTNKFTSGFQSIVDAYGVAKYQEVNPGLFTLVTFPFLFGMMFGDFGHGLLLTLIGSLLCIYESKLAHLKSDEMFGMIYGGRYMLLLMGLWSTYIGLVYNDMFSRSLEFWQSGWKFSPDEDKGYHGQAFGYQIGVYPFGVDPAWAHAQNKLLFINSYKMKQAILIGVIHMTFGICLQVYNHTFFKKPLNIWTEFVPQILFMESIFGYLCLLILYKWCTDWYSEGINPPALLNTLIFMFLSPGNVAEDNQVYSGQAGVQVFLLFIALICVPWMLIPKPYLLRKQHLDRHYRPMGGDRERLLSRRSTSTDIHEEEEYDRLGQGDHSAAATGAMMHEGIDLDNDDFDFGEIVVHQVIHTIEFCLGCISNTASYLRLWALSLAHAQLSEVLWSMTLAIAFEADYGPIFKGILILIAFALWFQLTLGILLVMEGLSAFLHALRLHWVEFQNKFYEGSGRLYEPFSFKRLEDTEDIVVADKPSGLVSH